jgi:4-amino-4-deoxy-L-arabinose transferase-like glycosyltransferase
MSKTAQTILATQDPFRRPVLKQPEDALTRRLRRWSPWVVGVAALLARLLYFAVVDQPPVAFDARRYVQAGVALSLAMTNPSLLTDSLAREQIDFGPLLRDRVSDEGVAWIETQPPDYAGSLDDVFFAGPVYPLFLSTVFMVSPRYDFWVVRILQALIDSLTAALIWLLARRLVSPAAAWFAGGLWIVYGPALYKAGELTVETISIMLLCLTLWAVLRGMDSPKNRRWMWLAGGLCAVMAMTRAASVALVAPVALGWVVANWGNWRRGVAGAVQMVAAYVVVIIPWVVIVGLRFGTVDIRNPEYKGGNLRSSNILAGEGYDLDVIPSDFWTYPVWRSMKRQPLAYAMLYARKFYRLWSRPYNDFRKPFPFGYDGGVWYHRVIVILALFGVLAWWIRAGPRAAIPLAVIAYFAALHMVFHVVARYNLPAMPLVTIAATCGAAWLWQGAARQRLRRIVQTAVFLLMMYGAIRLLRPSLWLLMEPVFNWRAAVWMFWISGSAAIVFGIWLLTRRMRRRPDLVVRLGATVVLVLIFLTQAVPREGNADWSVTLDRRERRIVRTLTFPEWLVADSVQMAFVEFDAVADKGRDCNVTWSADGVTRRVTADSITADRFFYPKYSYQAFLILYNHRHSDVRGWVISQMDSVMIDSMLSDRRLTITLSAEAAGENPGALVAYGDLPVEDYRHWVGPMFELSSLERYYEGGDPRLWGEQPLEFESANCEFVDGDAVHTDDLSDRWGRQVGQYRMLVTILTPGGAYHTF